MSETSYIHGTTTEEQDRLSLLNDILNRACLAELALAGGEQILDVGSGLGQFSRALARAAGQNGRVVGIERSGEQIAGARRKAEANGESNLVEFRQGDANALPLREEEWGTFDVVHTRFLLEHVSDPLAVVREMVKAARPGGRVVLLDDDHELLRLWPEPATVMALWRAYYLTYERFGNDPYVGRRLVELLSQAGAAPQRANMVFFGACAGDSTFEMIVDNFTGVLRGARASVVEQGLFTAERFQQAMDELQQWRARPDAAYWYALPWAEGRRPA